MMNAQMIFDLLTVAALLPGVFFMTSAALSMVRMPDVYHRMHGATKGVTLGIICMLLASAFALIMLPEANVFDIATKVALVIMFQFISNPVGAHLLAKAAHLDNATKWHGTIADELEEDKNARSPV